MNGNCEMEGQIERDNLCSKGFNMGDTKTDRDSAGILHTCVCHDHCLNEATHSSVKEVIFQGSDLNACGNNSCDRLNCETNVTSSCDSGQYRNNVASDNGHPSLSSSCRFQVIGEKSGDSISQLLDQVYNIHTQMVPCCLLAQDLLRLLLEQKHCDCVIQVNETSFHAHKCILSARSSYFDAMLGGSWMEMDTIVLTGVEEVVVSQMLIYLYGGVIEVSDKCPLGALIQAADMYSMEGLKEVVTFNLNMQYCHFFHRPCTECIACIPEALALSMMYNLEVTKDKCVKWINKNFGKVWNTKNFAMLPHDVLELCVTGAVNDLAVDSVIDTLVQCGQLNNKMVKLRWTEVIFDMVTRLMDEAIEFASRNFINVISCEMISKMDKQGHLTAFNRHPIEEIFSQIISSLSPEMSCLAYLAIHKLRVAVNSSKEDDGAARLSNWIRAMKGRDVDEAEDEPFSEGCEGLVNILHRCCRQQICMYIHQVAHTTEWELLTKNQQADLLQEANYVCIDTKRGKMSRPKLTSMQKKLSGTSGMSLTEYLKCHFGHTKSTQTTRQGTSLQQASYSSTQQNKRQGKSTLQYGDGLKSKVDNKPKVKQLNTRTDTKYKAIMVRKDKCLDKRSDALRVSPNGAYALSHRSQGHPEQTAGGAVETGSCKQLDMSLINIADIELLDLPSPICFPSDKLVPIFNVLFTLP